MKKIIFLLAGIALTFTAFSQKKGKDKALISRLEAEKLEAPQTQEEIDKNLILQYAIDNLLDVESTPSGLYYIMVCGWGHVWDSVIICIAEPPLIHWERFFCT